MSLASLFGFGPSIEINIQLDDEELKQKIEYKVSRDLRESAPLYFDGEAVSGKVLISVADNQKLIHNGIKAEFIGTIEMFYDRGQQYNFVMMAQEIASPGEIKNTVSFPFEFKNAEKQFETYIGINVKLRYFVRITIMKRVGKVEKEKDLWVHSYIIPPEINGSIKMEVGIEDCLHIEFEYNKSKRETTGAVPNQYNESETVTKYEIMDGAPVRGEIIPIRLFLGGFELTPTYRDVNKKFSTRYYLNLVLVDEENRRYFKQQEVTIYRESDSQEDIAKLENLNSSDSRSSQTIKGTSRLN
ncbi:Vacuolar protein sorting-associated protein 26B [Smittium culicis]|uniref:Vacuolar protein sorting-associated protein 26B n=2 Tax=Smittium culicis TaxID=133412 RepID=A0A1R1XT48_9FUNG|nr:Vacuolar protein sorting-associated protein 26B [Smittium culicis]